MKQIDHSRMKRVLSCMMNYILGHKLPLAVIHWTPELKLPCISVIAPEECASLVMLLHRFCKRVTVRFLLCGNSLQGAMRKFRKREVYNDQNEHISKNM